MTWARALSSSMTNSKPGCRDEVLPPTELFLLKVKVNMETLYATPESKAALYILGLVEELEAAGVLETSGGVGLGLTEKGRADYKQLKATGFALTKDETEKA